MAQKLAQYVWNNLGHCMKCMRVSFWIAAVGWLIYFVAASINLMLPWTFIVVLGPTALWFAHITVFSIKTTKRKLACGIGVHEAIHGSRRALISYFGQIAGAAALITALPAAGQILKVDYTACPDDGYAHSRRGFGSCGQFCSESDGARFPCQRGTRPVFRNDGSCTCCSFSECS